MQLSKAKFILLPICLWQGKSWNQEVSEVNLASWNNPKPESPEPPGPNSNTPNLGVREQDIHFLTLCPFFPSNLQATIFNYSVKIFCITINNKVFLVIGESAWKVGYDVPWRNLQSLKTSINSPPWKDSLDLGSYLQRQLGFLPSTL